MLYDAGMGYSVASWRSLLAQYAPEIPFPFLENWLAGESGGNPCAVGMCVDAAGRTADANGKGICGTSAAVWVKEAGIFQVYFNTQASTQGGATSAQLRAACVGTTQQLARALTSDEMVLQVTSGLPTVRAAIATTRAELTAAGATWSETSPDFWAFVKLQHGLPAIGREILPIVTQQLGRAPSNWREFRAYAEQVPAEQMSPGSTGLRRFRLAASQHTPKLASRYHDVLANAEAGGAVMGAYGDAPAGAPSIDPPSSGAGKKFLIGLGAVAGLAAIGWAGWSWYSGGAVASVLGRVTRRSRALGAGEDEEPAETMIAAMNLAITDGAREHAYLAEAHRKIQRKLEAARGAYLRTSGLAREELQREMHQLEIDRTASHAAIVTLNRGLVKIRDELKAKYGQRLPAEYHAIRDKINAPDRTYAQAKKAVWDELEYGGWRVALRANSGRPLQVPYATTPDGRLRLWFKPQAVWVSYDRDGLHMIKHARSLTPVDIRKIDPDLFRAHMERFRDNQDAKR